MEGGVISGAQGETEPKVIDNDRQFRFSFTDAKDQFSVIRIDLAMGASLEKLREVAQTTGFLPFDQYLLQKKNLVVSPKLLDEEKYKQAILIHDDLVERVKKFETKEQLEQIIKEVDEFIRSDF